MPDSLRVPMSKQDASAVRIYFELEVLTMATNGDNPSEYGAAIRKLESVLRGEMVEFSGHVWEDAQRRVNGLHGQTKTGG